MKRYIAGACVVGLLMLAPASTLAQGRNLEFYWTFYAGRTRLEPGLDIYNLLSANSVLTMTTRYGAAWQNATGMLPPRMFKLNLRATF